MDEQGRPTRWRIRRDELPESVTAQFDPFITRRLLSTDLEHGHVVVGVAHEAFLSSWPPLAAAITARAIHLNPEDAVPIDRVMLGIGGGPKPWEPLVRGMLSGVVSFALDPRDATVPVFRRSLVSADHVAHVRDLVFAGFGEFPARDLITRAEAGEVINLQKASEAKSMLSRWPAAASRPAVVPAAALSTLAASVIHAQEIAERFGLATSGVNAVLRRADVTGITGGFDRARALPLIADALENEDDMVALAARVGMRPGILRRRLRSVGPRYRPRGRPRRGACA